MTRETLFLSQHVYMCSASRYCVFLDAATDRYLTIRRSELEPLGPYIAGWERLYGRCDAAPLGESGSESQLARQLIEMGILSRSAAGTKCLDAVRIPESSSTLFTTAVRNSTRMHARFVPGFLYASARADWQLRRRPFPSVVERARRRIHAMHASEPFPYDRAQQLVEAFTALRLVYPRPYLCLFDSLALLEFLLLFGIAPHWVFGVTPEPFEAHCWLQEDKTIVNDTVERVAIHAPIMVV